MRVVVISSSIFYLKLRYFKKDDNKGYLEINNNKLRIIIALRTYQCCNCKIKLRNDQTGIRKEHVKPNYSIVGNAIRDRSENRQNSSQPRDNSLQQVRKMPMAVTHIQRSSIAK